MKYIHNKYEQWKAQPVNERIMQVWMVVVSVFTVIYQLVR